MLALAIQRRLERGTTDEEIDALVERYLRERGLLFTVDTLEFLRAAAASGRRRRSRATLLHVKPILSIRDGEVAPVKRVRGKRKAFAEFVEALETETTRRARRAARHRARRRAGAGGRAREAGARPPPAGGARAGRHARRGDRRARRPGHARLSSGSATTTGGAACHAVRGLRIVVFGASRLQRLRWSQRSAVRSRLPRRNERRFDALSFSESASPAFGGDCVVLLDGSAENFRSSVAFGLRRHACGDREASRLGETADPLALQLRPSSLVTLSAHCPWSLSIASLEPDSSVASRTAARRRLSRPRTSARPPSGPARDTQSRSVPRTMTATRRQTVFAGLDQPGPGLRRRGRPQPQRLELGLDALPGVGRDARSASSRSSGSRRCATCSSTGRAATSRPPTRCRSRRSAGRGVRDRRRGAERREAPAARRGARGSSRGSPTAPPRSASTWFNQPWLADQLEPGTHVRLRGKLGRFGFEPSRTTSARGARTADFAPVYPGERGDHARRSVRTLVDRALPLATHVPTRCPPSCANARGWR